MLADLPIILFSLEQQVCSLKALGERMSLLGDELNGFVDTELSQVSLCVQVVGQLFLGKVGVAYCTRTG